jgi:hypothetical protein
MGTTARTLGSAVGSMSSTAADATGLALGTAAAVGSSAVTLAAYARSRATAATAAASGERRQPSPAAPGALGSGGEPKLKQPRLKSPLSCAAGVASAAHPSVCGEATRGSVESSAAPSDPATREAAMELLVALGLHPQSGEPGHATETGQSLPNVAWGAGERWGAALRRAHGCVASAQHLTGQAPSQLSWLSAPFERRLCSPLSHSPRLVANARTVLHRGRGCGGAAAGAHPGAGRRRRAGHRGDCDAAGDLPGVRWGGGGRHV